MQVESVAQATPSDMRVTQGEGPRRRGASGDMPYQLTVRRGFGAFAVLFVSQFVFAIVLSVMAQFIGAAFGIPGLAEQNRPLVLALALGLSSLVTYLWVRADITRFGPAFPAQIGLRPSRMSLEQTALLIVGVFFLTRVLGGLYAGALEELIPGSLPRGGAEQVFDQAAAAGASVATVLMFLLAAFVAPVVEEVVFRGYLQSALRRQLPAWGAISVAALVFAAIHGSLMLLPVYFIIGAGLGYVYERTSSVYAAIALHMLNNVIFSILVAAGWA
ncbi:MULTISPECIES: CPBP family intramembrane glutamic endopeptidase [Kordiimonas]|jgi:hypothetical protein|uniref:CPBP family intramembrane glutamic endopeptidase n=1 Tax=Kordiimonas TaxID=288021 RepID=UPI00257D577C|nr:CPBP family intramembrane glutamic endopeptidase [Kordiimonas sp. UBA4487]